MTIKDKLFDILAGQYDINIKDEYIMFDEFMDEIFGINNTKYYFNRNINKYDYKIIDKEIYLTCDKVIDMLKNSKKEVARKIYTKIKEYDTETIIDISRNILKYNGTDIYNIFDKERNILWVRGCDIAGLCGHIGKDHAVKIHVNTQHKIEYKEIRNLSPSMGISGRTMFIDRIGVDGIAIHSGIKVDNKFITWINKVFDDIEGIKDDSNNKVVINQDLELTDGKDINVIKIEYNNCNICGIEGMDSYWFWVAAIGNLIEDKNWSQNVKNINPKHMCQFPLLLKKIGVDPEKYDTSELNYRFKASTDCKNTMSIWINTDGLIEFLSFYNKNKHSNKFLKKINKYVVPLIEKANVEIKNVNDVIDIENKKKKKKNENNDITDIENKDNNNISNIEKKESNNITDIINVIDKNTKNDTDNNIYLYNDYRVTIVKDKYSIIWFKAKDVAIILGYINYQQAIRNHVDEEDRKTWSEIGVLEISTLGEDPQTVFINESGLYSLILLSKKQEAKPFKKWVTGTVLPAIRKTGSYTKSIEPPVPFLEHLTRKTCIYLGWFGEKDVYKFGWTDGLKKRLSNHKREISKEFGMLYCWNYKEAGVAKIENDIKSVFRNQNKLVTMKINNKIQTEIIKDMEYKDVFRIMDNIIRHKHTENTYIDKSQEIKLKILELLDKGKISESNAMILLNK